jgi:hypothetical protein
MMKIKKIILFSLLIVLGITLLAYGAFFHSTSVSPQQDPNSTALAKSEPQLIKEVTIGGVEIDESGNIKQTYSDPKKAPAACPT